MPSLTTRLKLRNCTTLGTSRFSRSGAEHMVLPAARLSSRRSGNRSGGAMECASDNAIARRKSRPSTPLSCGTSN
jgi:hypothetical protein